MDIHAKLACYDYHGAEVTGVSLNIREVTVSYAVHDAKQVPIQVDITGTPANAISRYGFLLAEICRGDRL